VQICRRRTGADSGGSSAVEVVIFPTAVTGAGEGIYPWDLKPQSTMTNPTVSYSFKDINGRAVVVSYHRQEKDLNRGRHPVVTFAPATRTDILAGAPGQRPLRVLIERHILAERLQGDDTSVPPSPRADGHRDRTREHPNRHLASYAGILQVDAFDGYSRPYLPGEIVEPLPTRA
jgi:hypothetical protein